MASNEERARLCGWTTTDNERPFVFRRPDGELVQYPPSYDTSLDACAELLRFVRKRGKEVELAAAVFGKTCAGSVDVTWRELWAVLTATPQQLCAAFDATFKDELEKIQ